MESESKAYSWRWVAADELLSNGPCDLLYAHLLVSAANGSVVLYDGENTNGGHIITMASAAKSGMQFHPPKPVYCRRGLFVDVGTNVAGVFVQWRELRGG